ncbi:MAG TPA: hypothetical protein VMF67_14790 [Rhizomicrobium sp.]|nr:hypothetical protein [Rhizomicrobium sp.]
MKKILVAPAAITLGIVGFTAGWQASAQPKPPPGMMQVRQPEGTFGFFPANQPANSNRVGIFVARRLPGKQPELYYCSTPTDATSKDAAACKQINAFPH